MLRKHFFLLFLLVMALGGCKSKNSAKNLIGLLEKETEIKFEIIDKDKDAPNITIANAKIEYDHANAMKCENIKSLIDKQLEMLPTKTNKDWVMWGTDICDSYTWENPTVNVSYDCCKGEEVIKSDTLFMARIKMIFTEK